MNLRKRWPIFEHPNQANYPINHLEFLDLRWSRIFKQISKFTKSRQIFSCALIEKKIVILGFLLLTS